MKRFEFKLPTKIALSPHNLTLNGARLKHIFFTKIIDEHYMLFRNDPNFCYIEVSASEWQNLYDSENPYRDMKRAAENLLSGVIELEGVESYSFCDDITYDEGNGIVLIKPNLELLYRVLN